MTSGPVIIVGASAAGISAAREIRSVSPDMPVTIFTDEKNLPYYRPFLTEYIGDSGVEKKSAFYLNQESWYTEKKIELRLGEKIVSIDPPGKAVESSAGRKYPFDRLILANGSTPFVPFKDAAGKQNVHTVRTLDDAKAVNELAGRIKTAVVIGGGLLGLEAANSLNGKGVRVTVVEVSDRILPRQLDRECSAILHDIVEGKDVALVTGKSIQAIEGEGTATGIRLDTGEVVQADMVVISIGVRPNVDLARNCGITVNRAVVVNDRMETSIPGIYACGDVAEFNGRNIALWMPAVRQGKVAGSNAAGREARFADVVYPAVLNSFGTKIFSAGDICLDKNESEYRIHGSGGEKGKNYRKLFFVNDKLVGFILIGDISESQKLTTALKNGAVFRDLVQ
ncbi:MAG: NAD(P)/FAD-dependent oxidoreductase [Spirochaetes bacterium]|nr:NAD(P)/FAD-dependent oxidoreductase [Spirochaetota bacterium]